ncbi:DNA replication/repair protein RecF [Thermomonas aquatica]|uniref:DNA replication and repair protein RecF n=1 Tax=Thermomonas aquatica TaxID=2202149 RepID=A0A5B7ZU87_9GAMM|nr:DNA replication/repair protein RecF [Thermomonas aquatica]QDA57362.1 DNA replication/repair protein RecF [Thermomonas aquatica]
MIVQRLRVQSFRRFAEAELEPRPGFNLVTGDNGSGKTSLLEALHLLAHGRSFRGRVRDGLVRQGEQALSVYVEWQAGSGPAHRAGLRHSGGDWDARLDGAAVGHLGELCEALAVVSFEPGSHALIDGSSEGRRRYLDWGLFHVERADRGGDFLLQWRRHARALKQRNALLRQRRVDAQLDAWEHELAQAGEALCAQREAHVARLQPHLEAMIAALLPGAGSARLELLPGWRRQELSLADALLLARDRDLVQGHTSVGPHRADLRLELRDLPGRDGLSRGQAKLAALALLLAQAAYLAGQDGHWPVLQLDDLASELDRPHQRRVLQALHASGAQVFVTGTEPPAVLRELDLPVAMFHVEHGSVARLCA